MKYAIKTTILKNTTLFIKGPVFEFDKLAIA